MGFTVIIAAYKNIGMIKRAIESVYNQEYRHFEILVCSDGDDLNIRRVVDDYEDPRIKYHFVEFEGECGYRSQNEMTQIAENDLIIYLDQDNIIYKNCFFRVLEEWEEGLGLLIYRINHGIGVIPKGEEIEHGDIDTLNGVVQTSIAKRCKMENIKPSGDSRFYKQVEQICKDEGYKVKFIKDILGVHN